MSVKLDHLNIDLDGDGIPERYELGGGGNANEREISWEDYKNLSEEEQNNGTTYYVPDAPVGGSGGSSGLKNGLIIEEFTYTGDGGTETIIEFPKKPKYILSIFGKGLDANYDNSIGFLRYGQPGTPALYGYSKTPRSSGVLGGSLEWNENTLKLKGFADAGGRLNVSGVVYTVVYIPE